jgi:hypothetical protein
MSREINAGCVRGLSFKGEGTRNEERGARMGDGKIRGWEVRKIDRGTRSEGRG